MKLKTMNKLFLITSLLTVSPTVSKAESVYMCEPCPAGYACNNGVKTICPDGTYSGAVSTSCTKCPAGTYSAAGSTSCTPCPDYQWSNAGAAKCGKVQVRFVLWDDFTHWVPNWFTMDRFQGIGLMCIVGNFPWDPKDGAGFCSISEVNEPQSMAKEWKYIFGDCRKFPCSITTTWDSRYGTYAIIDPANKKVELHAINHGVVQPVKYYYDALKW